MESGIIVSKYLGRKVQFDIYNELSNSTESASLLLFNDGQDLRTMNFPTILSPLQKQGLIKPLVVAGIHAGRSRRQEYGVASHPDFEGRGSQAGIYTSFILEEFLPYLEKHYNIDTAVEKSFGGFSLGGLSALDIVWNHADIFSKVGVFSGSLWWRNKGIKEGYEDDRDRIMHNVIRMRQDCPSLQFFFECGTEDEKCDRNNNGIIDSIDDTLDLILLLKEKGYQYPGDIHYHEIPGGKHNVSTWKQALPVFLMWGWGAKD